MAAARSPPTSESGGEIVLAAKRDDSQRSSGGAVVDLEVSLLGVSREGAPPRERVSNRARGLTLGGLEESCCNVFSIQVRNSSRSGLARACRRVRRICAGLP